MLYLGDEHHITIPEDAMGGQTISVTLQVPEAVPVPWRRWSHGGAGPGLLGWWKDLYSHLWNLVRCCGIGVLGAGQVFLKSVRTAFSLCLGHQVFGITCKSP